MFVLTATGTAMSSGDVLTLGTGTTGAGALGLLDDLEMVPEATATAGNPVNNDRLRVADSDGWGDHCGGLGCVAGGDMRVQVQCACVFVRLK